MFRLISYLFFALFLISFLRAAVRIVLHALRSLGSAPKPGQPAGGAASEIPLTGELKRDPVCGTYTLAASAIRQELDGKTHYFCSPRCRDQFLSAGSRQRA